MAIVFQDAFDDGFERVRRPFEILSEVRARVDESARDSVSLVPEPSLLHKCIDLPAI
jgi:hypothetical protein